MEKISRNKLKDIKGGFDPLIKDYTSSTGGGTEKIDPDTPRGGGNPF